MNEKILCVDDDTNILAAYQRQLRKRFQVDIATGGAEGLEAVSETGPYEVIVSDLRMPEMDGIQFLSRVREHCPDSVRIMLTGNADLETAIAAVNEGNIFRFLTKPCPPESLAKALEAGVEQYRLVTAERELLEKTLSGSVKILTEVLSLVSPVAFARAARARRAVKELSTQLELKDVWKLEIAAMLSQVGCVTVPEKILGKTNRGDALSEQESLMFESHPKIGHDIIANIPRLKDVAEIIAYQNKHYDGQGIPEDGRSGEEIPIGARILHVVLDFDARVASGESAQQAYAELKSHSRWYDPTVLQALAATLGMDEGAEKSPIRHTLKGSEVLAGFTGDDVKYEVKNYRLERLTSHMILSEDIKSEAGVLLVARGQEVTLSLITRLENFAKTAKIQEPFQVLEPILDPEKLRRARRKS